MRAEFFRPEAPDEIVGTAVWEGPGVRIEADDEALRQALRRVFRPSSVVLADPVLRDPAAGGPGHVEPGDLHWFRTAAAARGKAEGWAVRFVTETPGGWDPAGAYLPLEAWVGLREGGGTPRTLGTSRA